MIQTVTSWLERTLGLSLAVQSKLFASLVIVVGLWAVRRMVVLVVWRRVHDVRSRYRWQKTLTYVVVPIGLLLVGRVWFEGVGQITTYLGLVSAGVAIALKDLLANLAGWAFIVWRRPFEVGDRIQIGEHAGDVIDLRIFQFTLLEIGNWVDADQSTGRIIHVPNGKVLSDVLANYGKGFQFIWHEIPVMVTFESNWERAKTMLSEIVQKHAAHLSREAEERIREGSRRFMIFYTTLTPIVYTSVADSGVTLTMRYLCDPRKRRTTAEAIWEDVLRSFGAADDIDLAYPTQRWFDNRREGKSGARAPLDTI